MRNEPTRISVRAIQRDKNGSVIAVVEQEIAATQHAVFTLLRRAPFRELIAGALLTGGKATLEIKR